MENKIIIQENSFQRLEHKEPEKVKKYEHSMWKDIKRELITNKVALISLIRLAIIMIAGSSWHRSVRMIRIKLM